MNNEKLRKFTIRTHLDSTYPSYRNVIEFKAGRQNIILDLMDELTVPDLIRVKEELMQVHNLITEVVERRQGSND